uniref:Uncharacterized protein n=1 Tax=Meloidogyne javanica TaxID=6303 RepID=A0A915LJV5_MELJA
MHPGEGPSGSQSGWINFGGPSGSQSGGINFGEESQQPKDASTQLNNAILRMLEKVGDSHPFVDQTRPLRNIYFYFGGGSGLQPEGIYRGDGSGSQQPAELDALTPLNNEMLPMLEKVGDSEPYADKFRPLKNNENLQRGENVGEQYANLAGVYKALSKQVDETDNFLEKYSIYERQNVLMADMIKVRDYVHQHYNDYLEKQNADAGTGGHGQQGHGQQGHGQQGHLVQGRRGGGHRGPSGSQLVWLNFGGGPGSQQEAMNPGEIHSGSQSGWLNFGEGSGSHPGGMYPREDAGTSALDQYGRGQHGQGYRGRGRRDRPRDRMGGHRVSGPGN